jgi:transmembrane sensor
MNSSTLHMDPTAEDQAALWAARLDGSKLTPADQAALDAWLAGSPAHRTLLSQYCQFSADLEQQLPALVAAGAVPWPDTIRHPRAGRWLMWGAGAALAAAAAIAVMFWVARTPTQSENLATPVALRRTLALADGSRVELNAQTSLQIDIDQQGRRVRLASGEAFFAVHQDASRPFVVETPAGSVRVTGTQFDVRSDASSAFEVTVTEGSVRAYPAAAGGRPIAPLALTVGQQLSVGPDGAAVRALSSAGLDNVLAWRQGQIVFDDVPLRDALARFARYHGRGITATPAAGEQRVGGRYSLDDLEGFFALLEQALPVHVSRNLNGTVQVSLRTEP